MGYDPYGEWNWGTFFSGTNLLMIGLSAVAIAATVATCGAASPLMMLVAGVTFVSGTITAVNGVAEIVEAGTDYNFVRDGMLGGDTAAYELLKEASRITAEIGTTILGTYYAAKVGNVCFVAGTLILTAIGHAAIETIEQGDWVWAHNPETGETELKQVVQTFVNETDELVHVFAGDDEIICTNEHPFYSPVRGWTAASKLRAGDILVTVNGEYVVVEKIQHEILESPVKVYNFEVEGFHTYFVGSGDGLLVHNSCDNRFNGDQDALIQIAKENKKGVSLSDAQILVDWANEYGINNHEPGIHFNRSGVWSYIEHINIFKYHIPIK